MAPTPAAASKLRRATLRAALIRAGRRRNIDHQVERILAGLRAEQFRQPELIEQAMGQAALAHLRALDAAVANVVELEHALGEAFAQHPDAAIITSFPGLGTVLGARILGEIGDDRSRFADAKALKAFAGTAPVTRASGKKTSVTRRVVRNRRLVPSRVSVGAAAADPFTRRPRPLRPPPRTRRQLQRRRPQPGQPLLRHPVPLPADTDSPTTKPRPSRPQPRSPLDSYGTCDVCPPVGGRVAPAHCCAGAPSEPDVPAFQASGSSKPRGRHESR